jgi:hypothetical protein
VSLYQANYCITLKKTVRLVLWVLNTTINNISYVISWQVSLNDGKNTMVRHHPRWRDHRWRDHRWRVTDKESQIKSHRWRVTDEESQMKSHRWRLDERQSKYIWYMAWLEVWPFSWSVLKSGELLYHIEKTVRLVLWVLNTTINNISYVISWQVSLNDGKNTMVRHHPRW